MADPLAGNRELAPDLEEVEAVARGIATAVAPGGGPTGIRAPLLGAIAGALTDHTIADASLEPLSPHDLAGALVGRSPAGMSESQRAVAARHPDA